MSSRHFLAGAAALVVLVSCSGPSTPEPTRTATPTPTVSPRSPSATPAPAPTTPPPAKGISPFTGLPLKAAGPVLAVKIDNVRPARPPTNLAQADIVYIEPVESGLSRILAIYSSRLPRTIGPVRSARLSDLELLRQFGRPAFAYSGAQGRLLPIIAKAPLYDVSPDHAGNAYDRGKGRPAPHNLYARPVDLLARAPKTAKAHDIGFRFGPAAAGGEAKTSYRVRYSAFTIDFSRSKSGWRVAMDGKPISDTTGVAASPPTVVVQFTKIRRSGFKDRWGNASPYVETVGTGSALVLRDERAYDARWSRPKVDGGTTFTTPTGQPLTFAAGQVWVVFAPA